MRLIDADLLLPQIGNRYDEKKDIVPDNLAEGFVQMEKLIKEQPTAYDVDKVVEHLETARDGYSTAQLMTATNDELVKRFIAKEKAMNLSIEIVKAGGIDGN